MSLNEINEKTEIDDTIINQIYEKYRDEIIKNSLELNIEEFKERLQKLKKEDDIISRIKSLNEINTSNANSNETKISEDKKNTIYFFDKCIEVLYYIINRKLLEDQKNKCLEENSSVLNMKYYFTKKLILLSKKFEMKKYTDKFENILKNFDIEKIKEDYKNLKREIIEKTLSLDKLSKRAADIGYSFYFKIFKYIGLPIVFLGTAVIGYIIYKKKSIVK